MTANTQPIFGKTPNFWTVNIANADAQAVKTVGTAGANGGRVMRLGLLSTDTSNRDVGIYINGTLVGAVSCPLNSGQASTVATKNVLSDTNMACFYFDPYGNLCVDLPASATLGVAALATVTSGKIITAVVTEIDF